MSGQSRETTNESGAVLILTLIFITTIGLIGGALISYERTINRQSFSTRKVQVRETGTNTGLEWAVNSIRQGQDGFCQGSYTREVLTVGGREVEVICKGPATGGTTPGLNSFALYLNNASPAAQNVIKTAHAVGATPIKNIVGPVYNGSDTGGGNDGWDLNAPLYVDGDVLVAIGAGCVAGATSAIPTNLNPVYNTVKNCTVPLSAVTPAAVPAPCSPLAGCTDPVPVSLDAAGAPTAGAAACKVFAPGRYTTAPSLAANNYFQPGVYYFELNNTWRISSAILAGAPAPATATARQEQKFSSIPACVGAPAPTGAPGPSNTYGVVFVLGKGTSIDVRNNGRVELFTYNNGTVQLPSVVVGNYAGVTAWALGSTLPLTKDLISVGVAQPEFILHSGVFAPDSAVLFKGSNNAMEMIRNTAVLGRFEMDASASITNANFGRITGVANSPRAVQFNARISF